MNAFSVIALIAYVLVNLIMSKLHSAKEMKAILITGQNLVGMVFSNLFYAPAWLLKGLRRAITATVR